MKRGSFKSLLIILIIISVQYSFAQVNSTSKWIKFENGKLVYISDSKGNKIPDFSYCGYKASEVPIPTVPVVKTITPVSGDNLANIQNAINEVATYTPDVNGFRGAILLKAGLYTVSNSIKINTSGIILRGEGNDANGTIIYDSATFRHDFIKINGSRGPSETANTRVKIMDAYVPIGSRTFTVNDGSGFAVGDFVSTLFVPKQAWIDTIHMAQYAWTIKDFTLRHYRKVTAVNGNQITIDVPIVNPIDTNLALGYLFKCTWDGKIENVGIENLRLRSYYASSTDENHAWRAIAMNHMENSWVKDVIAEYFGFGCVDIQENGIHISVVNCQMLDPKSQTTGGRKYSFDIQGQLNLVRGCITRGGRHDYVTEATVNGPNAFVYCNATNQRNDIGPHERWANGLLYDNIISTGRQNVQNRADGGSGQGWSGAQVVYWNCVASKFIVQSPPQFYNWAFGCKDSVTNVGDWYTEKLGEVESTGTFVGPQSLFDQQLQERLLALNQKPIITMVSPTANTEFQENDTIEVVVNANDIDGTIAKVIIFDQNNLYLVDSSAPYSVQFQSQVFGSQKIYALAIDNLGKHSDTVQINFIMNQIITNLTDETSNLSVYPNPTSGKVYFSKTIEHVKITSVLGEEYMRVDKCDFIDISNLPKGIYVISVDNYRYKCYKE